MNEKRIKKTVALILSFCLCFVMTGISPVSTATTVKRIQTKNDAGDTAPDGSKLVMDPAKLKLKALDAYQKTTGAQVCAHIVDASGNRIQENITAEFTSSDKFIIKVADYGNYAFVTGVGVGTAYVHAKYWYGGAELVASCKVTVEENISPEEIKKQEESQKKTNPMRLTGKTITTSAYKTKSFKISKAVKISKAKGKLKYKKITGDSKIKINKKSGKVTVKKGLARGMTYTVMMEITAKGNKKYKKTTQTVFFYIKVKF